MTGTPAGVGPIARGETCVVEVDGLRLQPPFTRYGRFGADNRVIPFKAIEDIGGDGCLLASRAVTGEEGDE